MTFGIHNEKRESGRSCDNQHDQRMAHQKTKTEEVRWTDGVALGVGKNDSGTGTDRHGLEGH